MADGGKFISTEEQARFDAGANWRGESIVGRDFVLGGHLDECELVELSKAVGDKPATTQMRVGGLISTDMLDRDGQKTIASGLDFSELLVYGWFNNNHAPGTIVGVPTWVGYLKRGQKRPSGKTAQKDGWYVEGYLIDCPAVTGPDGIWTQAKALEGTGRHYGFSVEGKILELLDARGNRVAPKDPNGRTIARALVREIAVTKKPVNMDTYMDLDSLAKALEAGEALHPQGGTPGDGGPLREQSLQGAVVPNHQEKAMKKTTFEDFEKEREGKGTSKEDYAKALETDDPDGAKLYKAMCETNELKKALADKTKETATLAKSLDGLAATVEGLKQHVGLSESTLNKGIADADTSGDVGPWLTRMSADMQKSLGELATNSEANARATIAVGRLVGKQNDHIEALTAENAELRKGLADLKSEVAAIGNSPVVRRGASNLQDAQALAQARRGQGAQGADEFGALMKGVQDEAESLRKSADSNGGRFTSSAAQQRYGAMADLLTYVESNPNDAVMVTTAMQRAKAMGIKAAA